MNIIYTINAIITFILISLLLTPFFLNVFNILFFSRKKTGFPRQKDNKDIACVITAYNNLDLAMLCAASLLKQNYENYHIYIVADECDLSEINYPFNSSRLSILSPSKKLGSKVKSMSFAIENFNRNHNAIAIFDPDNLAHENFLSQCNKFLLSGYNAVQGKRIAKNLDTKMACLDAMGEIYYNYISKEASFNMGSSSIIAGSGMVIETTLFKGFFNISYIKENINGVIPGEDKILHYYVVNKNEKIAFAKHALVYDEKVNNAHMIKTQRTRWINSYLLNFSNAFSLFCKGLFTLNFNKFLSGVLTIYPPLFLLILLSSLFIIINLFFSLPLSIGLAIACLVFFLNFILVLKLNKAHRKIWFAFWGIPFFIINQILALFSIRKSNKEFLTTKNKKKMSLEEVVKEL